MVFVGAPNYIFAQTVDIQITFKNKIYTRTSHSSADSKMRATQQKVQKKWDKLY